MPPAARQTDMHLCPMQTPAAPSPIPHVGGPVMGPCVPTVLIGKLPAAVQGDMCTCVGPPDAIKKGSTTVNIGGKPAARLGDPCEHGGAISFGFPTVNIGG
ncbi:PAAR domain-containing protein [Massilia scottii]|uniref:PAAR domain-containing protein n=1 Tax=Massilia scottii TaxID=3057166 RepID=UPI0027967E5A|nr:PAAR domain-containing protein [Massilia sp. CCM 9029]MDQ1829285.1 PAAR domain-containing protein [Massilia sp. CCM 9029]